MVADVEAVLGDWDMGEIVADAATRGREAVVGETATMQAALAELGATDARPTITPGAGTPRARTPRTTPSPSPATSRSAREQRERDAEAVGAAVEGALADTEFALAVDTEDEALEEWVHERARLEVERGEERRERDLGRKIS
jgi:hypothetical protein